MPVERWSARAIWVMSRADANYPRRFKTRLKEDAPPLLYGCGDAELLEMGGLAVVGSRHVDDELAFYRPSIIELGRPFSQFLGESQGRSEAFSESVVEQPARARTVEASNRRNSARGETRNLFIARDTQGWPGRLPSPRQFPIRA
jgi:hypothetical protein